MAVVDVVKSWEGSSAALSKELDFETPGEADFAAVYTATTNNANDDADDVLKSNLVPQIGDQKGNEFKWVTNITAQNEGPFFYTIVVSYTSLDFDPKDPFANPLTAPAKVKWKTVKANGEIDEDVDGKPILTPAGEPVRGITRPFSDISAIITQAFSSFNPVTFYDFIDTTNDKTYLGFPTGTGKVEVVDADPQELKVADVAVTYYNVTVEIAFRNPIRTTPANAWRNRRVLKGNIVLDDNNKRVPATVDGENAPGPVFLNAAGKQLPEPVDPNDAVWVEDKIFPESDFDQMGFNFS